MKLTEDQKELIINIGVFGYSPEKTANILGVDLDLVKIQMNNPNSEFNKLLQKGKDMSDYVIDLKLFEMAKAGDIKALEKLNYRRKTNK